MPYQPHHFCCPCIWKIDYWPVANPSCLQTTFASTISHSSSHTVPQTPLAKISTRPSRLLEPPTSRRFPRPESRNRDDIYNNDTQRLSSRKKIHLGLQTTSMGSFYMSLQSAKIVFVEFDSHLYWWKCVTVMTTYQMHFSKWSHVRVLGGPTFFSFFLLVFFLLILWL